MRRLVPSRQEKQRYPPDPIVTLNIMVVRAFVLFGAFAVRSQSFCTFLVFSIRRLLISPRCPVIANQRLVGIAYVNTRDRILARGIRRESSSRIVNAGETRTKCVYLQLVREPNEFLSAEERRRDTSHMHDRTYVCTSSVCRMSTCNRD